MLKFALAQYFLPQEKESMADSQTAGWTWRLEVMGLEYSSSSLQPLLLMCFLISVDLYFTECIHA